MGKHNKQNKALLKPTADQQDLTNFRTVFFYCSMIILLPILAFFLSKTLIFDGFLSLEPIKSNICSAVTAVIALHVALGMYIYRAYNSSKTQQEIESKLE